MTHLRVCPLSFLEIALSNKKVLLDRKEVASRTGLSLRTITKLISAKKLKSIRVGRRRLVPVSELNRFIKRSHKTTKSRRTTRRVSSKKHHERRHSRRQKLPPPTRRIGKLRRPRLQPFEPPTTIKQYLALSVRDQYLWDRIVQAPAMARSKGWLSPQISHELSVPQELILRLAGDAFRKLSNGKIVAKKRDRLLRLLPLPSPKGLFEIFVNDSGEASRVGAFWNAVAVFINTGDSSGVQAFEGDGVTDISGQFHFFLTDLEELRRQASFGTLRFESMYGRSAQ
jgi:excisionase family DNA binding protein